MERFGKKELYFLVQKLGYDISPLKNCEFTKFRSTVWLDEEISFFDKYISVYAVGKKQICVKTKKYCCELEKSFEICYEVFGFVDGEWKSIFNNKKGGR